MRLLPRSWPTRIALATATAALAVLLVGSTAAVAATTAAPQQQSEADGSTSPEVSAAPPACADELVTFHRDGTVGDDRAVAITAQALQRGVDGWQRLAWQAGTGTTLTLVVATGVDGDVRALPPTPTGTVEHVLSLTFCGSRDTSGEASAEPDAPAVTAEPETPAPTAEPEPPVPTGEPEPPVPTAELPSEAAEVDAEQVRSQPDGAQQRADDDPGRTDAAGAAGAEGGASVRPDPQHSGALAPDPPQGGAIQPDPRQGGAIEPDAAVSSAPGSTTSPAPPVAAARTSEVLHPELAAATGRASGRLTPLLASLLAAAGIGAAIAAARQSTTRTPRTAASEPHAHLEAGR